MDFAATVHPVVLLPGSAGMLPVPAEYDGDGLADLAVFDPSNFQWIVQNSTAGRLVTTLGVPGERAGAGALLALKNYRR